MSSKLFNLNPRKPNALSEEAARKLEEAIAAKGEGVAGQAATATVPLTEGFAGHAPSITSLEAHELTSSAEPMAAMNAESAPAPVRNAVSSRARSITKSRARELPSTGVGTMHNPRVRKTDGVKTRSTTVHLPIELAKKLAVHCAMSGRKQSDVIAEAVESVLGN